MELETVKIQNGKDDYTIINAEDFDEKVHKLFVEPKAKPAKKDATPEGE